MCISPTVDPTQPLSYLSTPTDAIIIYGLPPNYNSDTSDG